MWRGTLSPRKVDVLIRGLPADSATRMSINGAPLWNRSDYILADIYDATQGVGWLTANKDVPRKDQTPAPKPYPRPGVEEASKKANVTAADLLAFRERTRRD